MHDRLDRLHDQLDGLQAEVTELGRTVRHAASRRALAAQATALAVLALLVVLALAERSVSRHADCERANEVRAAIRTSDEVRTEAFIASLEAVLNGSSSSAEDRQRRAEQADALRQAIEEHPSIVEAKRDLGPRTCSWWPY